MNRSTIKFTKEKSGWTAVLLFVIYSFYYDLFDRFPNYIVSFSILIISSFLAVFSMTDGARLLIKKSQIRYMAGWLFIMAFFLFIRNRWIEHDMWWRTVRWCWAILIVFCIMKFKNGWEGFFHKVALIGFPNVIATLFFFIFSNSYSVMHRIYGYWPGGTSNGKLGYKAGLTNHYSHNAIMISVVLLIFVAEAYYYVLEKDKRKQRLLALILAFISFFSLVLTAKRGHFLFCALTVFLGLMVCSANMSFAKKIRVIVILALLTIVFLSIYEKVPELSRLIERLSRSGEDYSSLSRFQMWKSALELFSSNPVIGIGWGGFRYDSPFQIEAHNVYFQLLAETGVIGTAVYVILNCRLVQLCLKNTRALIKNSSRDLVLPSICALFIQVFYLLYSLTGNCLYDITFCFYTLSIGTIYVCSAYRKKQLSQNNNMFTGKKMSVEDNACEMERVWLIGKNDM